MSKRKPRKGPPRKKRKTVKVNSKTYKPHERAPRGTYKKAALNDAMKLHGERMRDANVPARLINGSLLLYRENFPGGQVWPKLVSHFARQAKQGIAYSVDGISNWEIDIHRPAGKIMLLNVDAVVQKGSATIEVTVNYKLSSRFLKTANYVSGFLLTVIVLFPDFIKHEIIVLPTVLPVKAIKDESPYVFLIDIPPGADSYLLCFKADPCKDGLPILDSGNPYRVMKILQSGLI